jgi:antitoxin component YwqK of YwqJK toxin-antitoxin module
VHYYHFFSQLLSAENEGKSMLSRNLSDRQYLKQLQFNNFQWDSARTMLRAHSYVPAKLRKDTSTLSHYIGFRMQENDYKVRMIRDEKYILMDSLEILQDSIRKYLQIEHPVPVNLENARVHVATDSVPAQSASADRVIRVWYDSNWVESEEPGPYYRIGVKDSIGRWQGSVRDFYEDGTIQMKGAYKDSRRDGIFLYYSHHNTYTSAGRYADNRSIGKWQTFHNNGKLESEIVYGEGMFTNNIWDSTGVAVVSGGRGTIAEFYQDGRKKSEGQYNNGSREGIWMGWHPDGSIYYKEEFNHGLLVHGRSRAMNGEEFIYDGSTLIPVPRNGHRHLKEYISESVRKINSPVNGVVRMVFRVTPKGILTDFEIDRSVSPELDQKAIDLIKGGPGWIPAKLHGHQPVDGFAWIDVSFHQ